MKEISRDAAAATLFVLLAAGMWWAGLRVRQSSPGPGLAANTVQSYYFDKTQRLWETGRLPEKDMLAGNWPHRENVPPLLAYATLWSCRAGLLGDSTSAEGCAARFPLLIYDLWFASLLLLFSVHWSPWIALAAAGAFSFMPVSVELTSRGFYLEETVGNWALFLSAFFLAETAREGEAGKPAWTAGGILAVTALDLSWQQFPILYAAASALLLAEAAGGRRDSTAKRWAWILGAPLVLGHWVSRGFAGSGYSPFSMLRETSAAVLHWGDPDLIAAMGRADWSPTGLLRMSEYFGPAAFTLVALGLCGTAARLKEPPRRAFAVFGLLGLVMLAEFAKERFFAMSLCLPLLAAGLETVWDPRPALSALVRGWKPLAGAAAACLLVPAGLRASRQVRAALYRPKPVLTLEGLEAPLVLGAPRKIAVTLRNSGGYLPPLPDSFAGLHVEVENAEVHDVAAFPQGKGHRLVFKDFAFVGNAFFFETKKNSLPPGAAMRAEFTIKPYGRAVRILYRGWIPGYCSGRRQREALEDLREGWRDVGKAGWRNEACLERVPAGAAADAPPCRVPVFAAHKSLQSFRCLEASAAAAPPPSNVPPEVGGDARPPAPGANSAPGTAGGEYALPAALTAPK